MSSVMETMPEEARLRVLEFTKKLFTSETPANSYRELTPPHIIGALEQSRLQPARGEGLDVEDALSGLGRKRGFVYC